MMKNVDRRKLGIFLIFASAVSTEWIVLSAMDKSDASDAEDRVRYPHTAEENAAAHFAKLGQAPTAIVCDRMHTQYAACTGSFNMPGFPPTFLTVRCADRGERMRYDTQGCYTETLHN
jgi:hypothetical protein